MPWQQFLSSQPNPRGKSKWRLVDQRQIYQALMCLVYFIAANTERAEDVKWRTDYNLVGGA